MRKEAENSDKPAHARTCRARDDARMICLGPRRSCAPSPMAPTRDNGSTPPTGDPPAPAEPGTASVAPLDDVFPAVYDELRRVAHRHLRGERPEHTLGTTALVHEAYLELVKLDRIRWHGRAYVLAAASRAMRRILIDYAVARRAEKRGGGAALVPLDDAFAMAVTRSE